MNHTLTATAARLGKKLQAPCLNFCIFLQQYLQRELIY